MQTAKITAHVDTPAGPREVSVEVSAGNDYEDLESAALRIWSQVAAVVRGSSEPQVSVE